MSTPVPVRSAWLQRLSSVAAAVFALVLLGVLVDMPIAAAKLSAQVMAQLPHSGVAYPVTAVLLNFRGYDTLLEIGVLLLAVFGALVPFATSPSTSTQNTITTSPLLASLVRMLVPLVLLVAAYLLWAGSHRAGGHFRPLPCSRQRGCCCDSPGCCRCPPLRACCDAPCWWRDSWCSWQ